MSKNGDGAEIKETAEHYIGDGVRAVPSGRLSFEEFLQWADEDTWAEWVEGEVRVMTPASARHQKICAFLVAILTEFTSHKGLGEVLFAPFLVRLPEPLKRGREPDLIFVAKERLSLLKPTYLDGAPDLVVEITSPESIARDRGEKFVEYEAAGVREYWLIDPDRKQVEFYRLGENGRYCLFTADAGGIYRCHVIPGLWLRVDWLWQEPLPSVLKVLRELGI
ncbi:MAG: hypothetical protein PWP65_298 [Clostridia bacterium]|nr:hypothetical protein [Clostridia bacterium]